MYIPKWFIKNDNGCIGMNCNKNIKRNPNPIIFNIANLNRCLGSRNIKILPARQIIPLTRGNKYRKAFSRAILIVMKYNSKRDTDENQAKNSEIIISIQPIIPKTLKCWNFSLFIIILYNIDFNKKIQIKHQLKYTI